MLTHFYEPRIRFCGLIDDYNNNILDNIDLAYSMTVHKAQGKGYDTVVIVINKHMKRMLYRNLLYTAITRAVVRCYLICDGEALIMAKREGCGRVTRLF